VAQQGPALARSLCKSAPGLSVCSPAQRSSSHRTAQTQQPSPAARATRLQGRHYGRGAARGRTKQPRHIHGQHSSSSSSSSSTLVLSTLAACCACRAQHSTAQHSTAQHSTTHQMGTRDSESTAFEQLHTPHHHHTACNSCCSSAASQQPPHHSMSQARTAERRRRDADEAAAQLHVTTVKRGFEVWWDTGRLALVPVNTATCNNTHTHTTHPASWQQGGKRREGPPIPAGRQGQALLHQLHHCRVAREGVPGREGARAPGLPGALASRTADVAVCISQARRHTCGTALQ
jgi:hypothetical protein